MAEWVLACADGQQPKGRREISVKVREVLLVRHASNKRRLVRRLNQAERPAAGGAVCGVEPCPMAKWKRCPVCGPKSSLCKIRACSAARKPLLLGYSPAVPEL